jgi:zinc protease
MQTTPVGEDELARAKAILIRQMPLSESSVNEIARGLAQRRELGLALDEPTLAARQYIALTPQGVQAAFKKWMRPNNLVRASQGPAPQ